MKTHKSEKRPPTIAPPCLPGLRALAMTALAVLLCDCFGGGQPGRMMEQYALDYSPVAPQEISLLPEAITVEHFSAAQLYSTTAMVYQEEPYQRNQYLYHRWRVNPADLVSDYLLRDLRSANMFKGVFQHRSNESGRYLLEGDVEEFQENIDKENHRAILSLNVTLLDTARTGLLDRILFQKNYRIEEPIDGKSPAVLAEGMGRAVAMVSKQLLSDVSNVVQAARMPKRGD